MRTLSFALVLALAPACLAQSAGEKKATLAYLAGLRADAGGYRPDAKADRPSLRGTSAALRAVRYFGGEPADPKACEKFVLSCLDEKTGGFADRPGGEPDVIVTAVGLMALVEMKVPTKAYEPRALAFLETAEDLEQVRMAAAGLEAVGKKGAKADAWAKRLAAMRNEDGTFGKGAGLARDTGSYVACVLRLGGTAGDAAKVAAALDARQRADGAFGKAEAEGSDLDTTYRVMRTYHMTKRKPAKAKELRAFVARCRGRDGGYGVEPGRPSSAGGTYFAGVVLHWLDE